jgi:flagellar P-ring protein precursor FlgI
MTCCFSCLAQGLKGYIPRNKNYFWEWAIMTNITKTIRLTPQLILKEHIKAMFMRLVFVALTVLFLATTVSPAGATVRIKDIVEFEGVRDNILIGYGLVVGLNGTGDTLVNSPFTQQSLVAMLERMGVNVRNQLINTNNIAAVMITAKLPPFANQGTGIDANISALGDAESLRGGTLLATPLLGADGEIYAVAQGSVVSSGFTAGGNADGVTQNIPTQARLSNGAVIEKEINFGLDELQTVRISLRNPDFTTARRIEQAVNGHFKFPAAEATDPGTVILRRTPDLEGSIFNIITDIEQLMVTPDQVARVVIDQTTGIIVMGQNVQISTVAVAQGNLTIRVTETPVVSQPQPFSQTGTTEVVDRTAVGVDTDSGNQLGILERNVTLQDLVSALNSLGVGPRDMISILQSIKASGALQAEIELL